MPCIIKVTIKNTENNLKHKELSYDIDELYENPFIKKLVDDTIKKFTGEIETVRVSINLDFEEYNGQKERNVRRSESEASTGQGYESENG